MGFTLLTHLPYSPVLALSDFFLFSDLKNMLAGKKLTSNDEVIAETGVFLIRKRNLYYKYTRCIGLQDNYAE